MIETTLGRYQLLEPLGRGGMGEVYLADDPALGRKVAVKVLPAAFQHDPELRNRLTHEARAASALNHPNIVVIHDIGESAGSLFVAMELIQGETLREWAQRERRQPSDILKMARQATAALHVAHEAGLVHRDLKPENLMVRHDGLLKILDFGLARSLSLDEERTAATIPGTILGTAPYMSPEQVLGQAAGPASDLFSLGTILYELLTGTHPFGTGPAIEIMHRILHETPEPPSRVNPSLSASFDFVMAKALSKDPQRRHASARDLGNDLETLECGCDPAAPASVARAGKGETPRALAVLPFKNIGGDPSLTYLGMGLADAVITQLSASPDLVVRATSAIARYQDQAVDARVVGQELQADVVLDASFQRAGERLRATARLVEAHSGRSLWADKIDVRFQDMFDVQDQVARGIADALTARLTHRPAPSSSTPSRRFVPSSEAYQHFMRGLESLRLSKPDAMDAAIAEFEDAVRLQPDYAQAWAYLGVAFHSMVDSGWRSDPIWYDKAAAALERALAIDPEDGHAHHLAGAQHLVHGRKREAYRELLESNRRLPHHWANFHFAAYLFRLCDMLDDALLAWERTIEVEPNVPWGYWGASRLLLLMHREEDAQTWADRLFARTGRRSEERGNHLLALIMRGQFQEVVDRFGSQELSAAPTFNEFYVALAHLMVGNRERAASLMSSFEKKASIDMDSAGCAASFYAHAGDLDRAFRYLDRGVELGLDTLTLFEDPSWYGPMHAHPRWPAFIDGVRKRVEAYRREFRWPLPGS